MITNANRVNPCRTRTSLIAISVALTTTVPTGAHAQTSSSAGPATTSQPEPAAVPSGAAGRRVSPSTVGVASVTTDQEIGEIIVTAQKREQNLNDVGMSISAIGAPQLVQRGVTRAEDLARLVPSLTVTQVRFDVPTYTLRGVGFFDNSLSATSTVSMYVDQVPIAYPIMARGAPFDLERIEVLKGPQGTVFGQNSTGGLVNYIAAKPTKAFSAGADVSYSRFGLLEGDAYISGPIASGVQVRLAGATSQGGAWQTSATRNARLGDQRFTRGRLIVNAQPVAGLRVSLGVSGWIDKSDTRAPRTVDFTLPTNGEPVAAILNISRNAQAVVGDDPRSADWDVDQHKLRRNDSFIQPSLRADLDLTSNLTVTSITEYAHFKRHSVNDGDGTPALNSVSTLTGTINDFSQELRLAGRFANNHVHVAVGGNYQHTVVADTNFFNINTDASGFVIPGAGSFNAARNIAHDRISTKAVFANADIDLFAGLTLSGGLRYTENDDRHTGCTQDSGNGQLAGVIGVVQRFVLKVPVTTAAGQCVTILNDPGTPAGRQFTTGTFTGTLGQHNASWRAGLNWKPLNNEMLLYANVSRGFKSGSFPLTSAQFSSQLAPVTQEKLTAYEVGFKAPLADRRVQLNAAAFYYDYRDKQFRGRISTIFGQLEQLQNIPKSRIWGLEFQGTVRPISGLSLSGTATYINARILKNPNGTDAMTFPGRPHASTAPIPLTGQEFPFTPAYSGVADAQYEWRAFSGHRLFVGGSLTYQSRSKSGLTGANIHKPADITTTSTTTYNDPIFSMRPYTLIDLRAGISTPDGRERFSVWGRNIGNKYYEQSVTFAQDTITRYTGMPATYGVTLGFKM